MKRLGSAILGSLGVGLLAISAPAVEPARTRLTLARALAEAMKKGPAIEAPRAALKNAELSVWNARSAFLPSLDLNATQVAGSPTGTSSWSLTARETLWNNGRSWLALRNADRTVDFQNAALIEAREKLSYDLASQWFALSESEALLVIQSEKAALIEKQFKVMKEQFEQGLKTREDFTRIRAQLLRTQAELIAIRNTRDQTRVAILALLGVSAGDIEFYDWQPLTPPPAPTPPWKRLLESSVADLSANPTLQRLASDRARVELPPLQARLNYWPNVDLTATAFRGGEGPFNAGANSGAHSGTFALNPASGWSAGLQLSWNLWDWGILRRAIGIADFRRDELQERLRQEELALRRDVRQVELRLQRLKAESPLQVEVSRMEDENFLLVEDNYRRGRSSYLDLITALQNRVDARARWNSVYFSTLQTSVQLLQLEGKAHDWLLEFDENRLTY